MAKIKSSKDLILLLLYAPGAKGQTCEPIQGQTRLMKIIFLFKEEIASKFNLSQVVEESAFPKFEAFDYGPYAGEVYADQEFLVNYGFVQVRGEAASQASEEERQEFDYWTASNDD